MANKSIKYAIYPTKEQEIQINKTFGCCRFVYNQMLNVQMKRYHNGEKRLSKFSASSYCTAVFKNDYPFLKEVDKFALNNAVYNLDDAFVRYFDGKAEHPKYKSKHKDKKSYTTNITNGNIEIGEKAIKLPKLGNVKAKIHRKPKNDWILKSATISQDNDGKYYVSITFEYEPLRIIKEIDTSIGLDYKSDGLYVDSNGEICNMPHFHRLSEKKLAKAQRKLCCKKKGSNNYYKQKRRVSKIYKHVANQRKDYLHKKSFEIANQYDCVCVESLNMSSMANKGFGNGKATLDNGYGMFLTFLEYKLNDSGGCLVRIPKFFPSSQICSWCGFQNKGVKNLKIRKWACPYCGYKWDRDVNAAINIKKEGLRLLKA